VKSIPSHASFVQSVERKHAAFIYLFDGDAKLLGNGEEEVLFQGPKLVVFGEGDSITVATTGRPGRFLLASGQPLHEPISQHGPFVMNTRDAIEQTHWTFGSERL